MGTSARTLGTVFFLAATLASFVPATRAGVMTTTGTIVLEPTPFPSASDSQIFVFNEQQHVPFVDTQPLDFGSIAHGTLVNSHYLQYDPASPTGFIGTGSVTFDQPILGLITSTENLTADLGTSGASDTYFGLASTLGAYPSGADPNDRGLGSAEDDLIIVIGSPVLEVESLEVPVPGNLDAIRVLTQVPEPITLALLALGGLGVVLGRQRRAVASRLAAAPASQQ